MDVCGVKITNEIGFLADNMMIKSMCTIMKERIWINRAASKMYFCLCLHLDTGAVGYSCEEN